MKEYETFTRTDDKGEIIESKRKSDLDNVVSTYSENPDLKVLKGRFGIYISLNKQNYKIPKSYDPTNLSYHNQKLASIGKRLNHRDSPICTEKSQLFC